MTDQTDPQNKEITEGGAPVPLEIGVAINNDTPAGKILSYPSSLLDSDTPGGVSGSRECVRFAIRKRSDLDDIPKAIYLYMPVGFSLADTAVYEMEGLKVFGRSAMAALDTIDDGSAGGLAGVGKAVTGGIGGLIDELRSEVSEGVSLGASMVANKLGVAGQAALLKQGRAINPFQNALFAGTGMRNFAFSYKLIAESPEESLMIREIENTFRKYLYPETSAGGFLLKYPPYFQIQFLRTVSVDDGEGGFTTQLEENPNLPFLHLTYLQSMSATYNSGTNVYYEGGAPVELDISLTFQEATNLTRSDLYTDSNSADYHYQRRGLQSADLSKVDAKAEELSDKVETKVVGAVKGNGD